MASNRLHYTVIGILMLTGFNSFAQNNPPQLGKSPVSEVVKAMTLEEKVQIVVGAGFNMPGLTTNGTGVGQTQDRVAGAAGTTHAVSRLGIPSIVTSDGPAGVRIDSVRKGSPGKTYYATAWPVATLLASSWDTSLVKRVGVAFGHEVKEYGIDVILGPAMNIHRNPLGGRNFEYYSEDPVVTGKIAAAMVEGLQSNGIGTSIKHFAANNQETDRNTVNTIVSERALREIYLKGFEIAVKQSQPWTVMSSYNLINGTYTSESNELLTRILRNEWGFKGFVMTDWFGGKDAVAQMKAGNNLLMPGTPAQTTALLEAVKGGSLSEKVLDEEVTGILNTILRSPSFKGYKYSDQPDLKADAGVARDAAAQSMVLLKNDGQALPINGNSKKIAVFGINGYELIAGGTGSGDVNKAYKVSLVQGLANAGYAIDKDVQNVYTAYLSDYAAKHPKKSFIQEFMNPSPATPEFASNNELVKAKAAASDLAIIAIGRNAGEGRDRKLEGDYELTDIEKEAIKNVAVAFHAQHKKVVLVLNIGGVINVNSFKNYADAILLAWQPGLEGGNAIADVLSGKVNPSGKLATTFPASYKDVPSAKNFPGKEFPEKATTGMFGMKAIPAEVTYEEGIYVGYRYYNTFHIKPAYEFGYGLSYTTFGYSNLKLSSPNFNGKILASVTITNTGKTAGKEVVQLYLTAPVSKIDKPTEELKGFAKTGLLQPGQSQTLSFTINPIDLASFNTAASSWIADAGNYTVKIAASSLNIKQTASFNLTKAIMVEKDNKVLLPQVQINELKK
ncbi:glycoside hydrolase family 3 C-terminal domain-containing protein [uncultured Mucilaginibacter sp.]|uniref:glycoside hydrolase family 3 C-terminal domain-containing protein n=1 Tax=uncultured Mucilaginibacter sp. TaxID=797541 RepID=UPI00262B9FA8|nr:glycoside hydrolase family 3 C-terminal domain-containing protein [uncultured Mucilaginibacter sp.]